jgi:hypothetical protein
VAATLALHAVLWVLYLLRGSNARISGHQLAVTPRVGLCFGWSSPACDPDCRLISSFYFEIRSLNIISRVGTNKPLSLRRHVSPTRNRHISSPYHPPLPASRITPSHSSAFILSSPPHTTGSPDMVRLLNRRYGSRKMARTGRIDRFRRNL